MEITAFGYPFSLLSLLSMIKNSSVKRIQINNIGKETRDKLESSSAFRSIVDKFEENNFTIKFDGNPVFAIFTNLTIRKQ